MKLLGYLIIGLLLLSSCHTTRKTEYVKEVQKDTTATTNTNNVKSDKEHIKETVKKDSVITIPHKAVNDSIEPGGLDEAKTEKGERVKRSYQKSENGLRAFVTIDTNGRIYYGCEADSLKVVLTNMVSIVERITNNRDSLAAMLSFERSLQSTEVKTSKKTKNIIGKWWTYIAFLIVVVLLYRLLRSVLKIVWKYLKAQVGR